MVKDLTSGPTSTPFSGFAPLPSTGKLVFTVNGQLWVTDGTAAGTTYEVHTAANAVYPSNLAEGGDQVGFVSGNGSSLSIWETAGTAATTQLANSLNPDIFSVYYLIRVGGTWAYAWLDCGPGSSTCTGLTPFTGQFSRGPNGVLPSFNQPTVVGDSLYYVFKELVDCVIPVGCKMDRKLFRNGILVGDIPGGKTILSAADNYRELTAVGDTLYFVADDGVNGWKVWRSDGSTIDLVTSGGGPPGFDNPSDLTDVNGTLYFAADNARGRGLFVVDSNGAHEIAYAGGTHNPRPPSHLTSAGNRLFFIVSWEQGYELWLHDAAGTRLVKTITPPQYVSSVAAPDELTSANGRLFFAASDGASGRELWTSDGSELGTVMVTDILPGVGSSDPSQLKAAGDRLYFVADDGAHGREMWVAESASIAYKSVYPIESRANDVLLDHFDPIIGTSVGNVTFQQSQVNLGQAAALLPGSYITYQVPGWYPPNPAESTGTVEMWVWPATYGGMFNLNWHDTTSPPPEGYILHVALNAEGRLIYTMWNEQGFGQLIGASSVPLKAWTHVAVTWAPSGTGLFVNGKLDARTPSNLYPMLNTMNYAYLNYWGDGTFSGQIDELHVSRTALGVNELWYHATGIRDRFNLADGALNQRWFGPNGYGGYTIRNGQMQVLGGGPIYWRNSRFGVSQEAFVTVIAINPGAELLALLLKVQGNPPDSDQGAIALSYAVRDNLIRVETRHPRASGWVQYPTQPLTIKNGDKIRVRVTSTGTVFAYVNDVLVLAQELDTADKSFFSGRGGRMGLELLNAGGVVLDDFGGGTITSAEQTHDSVAEAEEWVPVPTIDSLP